MVRILSHMDRTNWSIRGLLYGHNQRPNPSSNSKLNIFVSSFNALVGRQILSNFSISFKIKISFKDQNLRKHFLSSILFVSVEVGLSIFRFNTPFGGPIRLGWTAS